VALPDGDVLIAGGSAGTGPIASALLFVPSTGQFSSAGLGSMNVPRFGAAAASLPHGKVLIVGGMDATRPLATAEVLDPKTGTFTPTAGTMSESRWLPVAASLPNGEVLVAGGLSLRNGGTVLSSAELYDPKTQRFSKAHLGSMTTPREAAVAVSLADGRVLIAGGIARNTFLSSAELFDPASGNFSNAGVGAMSVPRLGAGAAPLPDGQVLIAGGTPDEITRLASAEVFESAPEAQSAPVSFGHVTRGVRSATQTLVVQNVGAQALRISSASVRGGAAGDFAIRRDACAGRRLAFGQSCTVTIRFRPQAAGLRKANIRLRDNERVQTRIRVSGVGIR
jgi:hypothetical protein